MSCPHGTCQHEPRPDGAASPGRRAFLALCSAGLVALLCPLRALAERKIAIALDKLPALKRVGGFVVLRLFDREVLLIRDADDGVHALTAICSHKHTRLAYDAAKKRVVCSNHGSWFTLDGVVKKGPAEKNLSPVYWSKLDAARQRILLKL